MIFSKRVESVYYGNKWPLDHFTLTHGFTSTFEYSFSYSAGWFLRAFLAFLLFCLWSTLPVVLWADHLFQWQTDRRLACSVLSFWGCVSPRHVPMLGGCIVFFHWGACLIRLVLPQIYEGRLIQRFCNLDIFFDFKHAGSMPFGWSHDSKEIIG